jgi:hypothetical protein
MTISHSASYKLGTRTIHTSYRKSPKPFWRSYSATLLHCSLHALRYIKNYGKTNKRTILQSPYYFYYLAPTLFGIVATYRDLTPEFIQTHGNKYFINQKFIVVFFLLGDSPRLNFIFRRFGTICSRFTRGVTWTTLLKMENCSETSVRTI